ncbi:hypothetical protein ACIRRH_02850 [Kitasatospora sp. NPDC101235]|uniref:hypothetical protein n=1 Tax=Kitasatospora sp. NPDC101235 TaxID=3364101 RepID=UPI0038046EC6
MITAARLSTHRVETGRGPATAPVWEFTLAGYPEPLVVVAVDPQEPRGVGSRDRPQDVVDTRGTSYREDGQAVEARIRYARCTAALPPLVYETEEVVVLIARALPPTGSVGCWRTGRPDRTVFRLSRPLGTRPVLDLESGTAVSMERRLGRS